MIARKPGNEREGMKRPHSSPRERQKCYCWFISDWFSQKLKKSEMSYIPPTASPASLRAISGCFLLFKGGEFLCGTLSWGCSDMLNWWAVAVYYFLFLGCIFNSTKPTTNDFRSRLLSLMNVKGGNTTLKIWRRVPAQTHTHTDTHTDRQTEVVVIGL